MNVTANFLSGQKIYIKLTLGLLITGSNLTRSLCLFPFVDSNIALHGVKERLLGIRYTVGLKGLRHTGRNVQ